MNRPRLSVLLLTLLLALAAPAFSQGDLPAVPRQRTLILPCAEADVCAGQLKDWNAFNPYLPGLTGGARTGFNFMLEPLYFYNVYAADPDQALIPWIATGHTYNDDFTQVTVNIREGVTWSDGQPWTARDLVFTINLLRDNAPRLRWSIDMQRQVAAAVVVDDLTAQITLTTPNPRFIFEYFTHYFDSGVPIVPAHIWEGQDAANFTFYDATQGWPVFTGPYRLTLSTPEQRIWDLRPDWWAAQTGFQPLPQVERLIYLPFMGENQRMQRLSANEIDTALDLRPANMRALLGQNPAVTTFTGSVPPYGARDWAPALLGFNALEAPFDDPAVRWAINHAIDRDQLVAVGHQGAGEKALLPFPAFPALEPFQAASAPLLVKYPVDAPDPARTEALMTASGWTRDADGFWAKGGQRLTFTIDLLDSFQDIAPLLVQQLRRAGFDARFRMQPDSFARMNTGQAPAFLYSSGGSVRDPWKTLNGYTSRFVVPTGVVSSETFWRWSNADFDALVDQMLAVAPDDPALIELYVQAMDIFLAELPVIPLTQGFSRIPHNQTYWTNWPSADNPYSSSAYWQRTWLLTLLGLEPAP